MAPFQVLSRAPEKKNLTKETSKPPPRKTGNQQKIRFWMVKNIYIYIYTIKIYKIVSNKLTTHLLPVARTPPPTAPGVTTTPFNGSALSRVRDSLGACGTQEGGCGGQRGGGGGEVTTGTAVTRSKMCFSWAAAVPGAHRCPPWFARWWWFNDSKN